MALAVSNLSARFRLVLALIIAIAVFASISVYIATRSLFSPIDSISESITYEVSAGSGVIRVANDLHTLGLVDSPLLFRLLAEWQGNAFADVTVETGQTYDFTVAATNIYGVGAPAQWSRISP